MDSKKMMAILVVAIVAVAAAGVYVFMSGDDDKEGSLKVVYLNKGGYETFMVAEEKGFYDDLDFNMERLLVTGSGQDAVNALLADDADIAATGEGPVINTLLAHRDDIVLLASYTVSIGGQVWVTKEGSGVLTEGPTQERADSMKGKTAVVIAGSSTESIFKRWCAAFNLEISSTVDPTKLCLKTVENGAVLLESFGTDASVDILAASQPYPTTAMAQYNAKKIGDSSDINANSTTILVTTKAKYDEKADMMKDFVTALYETTKYINANKTECIKICSDRIGNSVAEETTAFAGITFSVSYNDVIIDTLYAAAQAKANNPLTREFIVSVCPLKSYLDSLA